jgi:hypothetical protein
MKKILFIAIAVGVTATACKPKFKEFEKTAGSANFKTYVALGNSLTAGYADNSLYRDGQEYAYPNLIAAQMKEIGGAASFKQPLVADNDGGLGLPGTSVRLVLDNVAGCDGKTSLGPRYLSYQSGRIPSQGSSSNFSAVGGSGPYHNLGVPGIKVGHALIPGLGDPAGLGISANPYFVRFASNPSATILEDALRSSPTFFSLWLGNNDLLEYALSGGTNAAALTPLSLFQSAYDQLLSGLTGSSAKGVLINLPDVTAIPYFTTVPWNGLDIDQTSAAALTTMYSNLSKAAAAIYSSEIAAQYAFQFNTGLNAFVVAVPPTASNPLGIRRIKEGELITLAIPLDSVKCHGMGSLNTSKFDPTNPSSILSAHYGIPGHYFLDLGEVAILKQRTSEFNAYIKSKAGSALAYVDMNAFLEAYREKGLMYNGVEYSLDFVTGGIFSLDGIHLSPRGNAIVANQVMEAINETFGATLPMIDVNKLPGTVLP